jgi:hypothetical protein
MKARDEAKSRLTKAWLIPSSQMLSSYDLFGFSLRIFWPFEFTR